MISLARVAQPAAIAVLRQATALRPGRNKASDGLLPSKAHIKQNPNSDHNSGFAVDLTHDPSCGIDCGVIFEFFKKDNRVKYLIFSGRIWSPEKGERKYEGSNPHHKHLHISIRETTGNDTSPWFYWMGKPSKVAKVKSKLKKLPKKKGSS
jgi:hypothetical protein